MKSASPLVIALVAVLYSSAGAADSLHDPFDRLLQEYVSGNVVDYASFHQSTEDLNTLAVYIDSLEAADPSAMEPDYALAYWINLYNAATLKLILDHYPVDSIKDLGGLFSSPWGKKLVTVNGDELTLDNIEHDIIRKQFDDARIHFALNCAAVSCPPLAGDAYVGNKLSWQLNASSTRALSQDRWLRLGKRIWVSKIFDWYEDDFEDYSGSVRAYIARYRPDAAETILNPEIELKHMDYDWSLNALNGKETDDSP